MITALFVIAVTPYDSNAQSCTTCGYLKSSPTHANVDTATNTDTVIQSITISGYWAVVTIMPTVTKISGTVGGTLSLYGSIDGSKYALIDTSDYTALNVAGAQTFTGWTIVPSKYVSYQVRYITSGTMSAKLQTYAIWRKP